MAGLSVLLETHKNSSRKPQIISKATLHNPKISSSSPSPATTATAANGAAMSSFLQRCFLCRKELADGMDIYMYRGDRAFCSVECRHRQIFMDEDGAGGNHCAKGAAAVRASRRAAPGGGGGGFAY